MFIREGRKKLCICHYESLIQFQYQLPSTSSSSSESSSLSKVLSGISYNRNTGLLGSFTMRYWKLNVRYFYIEINQYYILVSYMGIRLIQKIPFRLFVASPDRLCNELCPMHYPLIDWSGWQTQAAWTVASREWHDETSL